MVRAAYLGTDRSEPAQFSRRPQTPMPKRDQCLGCEPEGHGPGFYPDIPGVKPDPNIGGFVESFRGMSKESIQKGLRDQFRELFGRDAVDDQELIDEMWKAHPSDGVGAAIDLFLHDNPKLRQPFTPEIQTPAPPSMRPPKEEVVPAPPTSMRFVPDDRAYG